MVDGVDGGNVMDVYDSEPKGFLLVRRFDWWWTSRYALSKQEPIVSFVMRQVNDDLSPVTGVLFVGEHSEPDVSILALKLNSYGWPEDATYEQRRRDAEEADSHNLNPI